VLPITTLSNLPTHAVAYNQIILTTSSIIFDDGQFDPNISSHDVAIRVTGAVEENEESCIFVSVRFCFGIGFGFGIGMERVVF
jgi:hypothetical protein